MEMSVYPASFFRGISNKAFIANGHILPDAFQFDEVDHRDDDYRELSINWNDCGEALELALTQKKSNGNLQFAGGVVKLDLATVKMVLAPYIRDGTFSYERQELDENPYHGNLLVSKTLTKQQRSVISGTLGLLAEANPTYPPNIPP